MNKRFNIATSVKILILTLFVQFSFAQADPQFSQYVFNAAYLNPGAVGMGGKTEINAIYRTQWTGYSGTFDKGGAPTSQLLSASIPFAPLKGGLGLYVLNDQIGGGSLNREMSLAYSYHKRVGNNLIGLGVSAGLYSKTLDGGEFRPRQENDPSIPNTKISQTLPDVGAGVYLYNPSYSLGLAVKHINQPAFSFSTASGKNPLARSLYLNGSMLIGVTYTIDVRPMFVIKSDFKTVSPEIGALVTYNSALWAGLNYRWQDAASFLAGGSFLNNKLRLGYAMDYIVFGPLAKSSSSHEILLSFYLNAPRSGKKSIIKTPRYSY